MIRDIPFSVEQRAFETTGQRLRFGLFVIRFPVDHIKRQGARVTCFRRTVNNIFQNVAKI